MSLISYHFFGNLYWFFSKKGKKISNNLKKNVCKILEGYQAIKNLNQKKGQDRLQSAEEEKFTRIIEILGWFSMVSIFT